ncbi:MAG TPA: single-stranded DNA-binding protein [Bacteroidia bacterium]|nr:single-stranded DNA-binding protein [Bacteroidia bacterium]HNT79058.1 single-stranded DNA-binding protein [Bacteroidia bacterium]
MSGINKVILIGNLGKDPEVKYVDGNIPVAKFPLATSETYKNRDGQKVDNTEWHNIVLWRGLAEVAEKYLKKGMLVFIEGKIKTRSWEDKDGNKKYMTEINGENLTILTRKNDDYSSNSSSDEKETSEANAGGPSDDLPF